MKNTKNDTTNADPKNVTIQTLSAIKAGVYERAAKRADEVKAHERDMSKLVKKIDAIRKRADRDASHLAFTINFIRVRA